VRVASAAACPPPRRPPRAGRVEGVVVPQTLDHDVLPADSKAEEKDEDYDDVAQ